MNVSTRNRPTDRSPLHDPADADDEPTEAPWLIQDGEDLVALVCSLAQRLAGLTHAELRIAELKLRGLHRKEISAKLGRSLHTIDHHLKSVRRKVGGNSSTALFSYAVKVLNASRPGSHPWPATDPASDRNSDDA